MLLSAFNGEEWQLNIVELSLLDQGYYEASLDVICGRVELGLEPHTLVEEGVRAFEELWLQWERYHVGNPGQASLVGLLLAWLDLVPIKRLSKAGRGGALEGIDLSLLWLY